MSKPWQDVIRYPLGQRPAKPRKKGLTMVIDKGLGLRELADLLETAGAYLDFLKFGFGTSALYSEELLRAKIELCKKYNVVPYPGGTLTEIAYFQGSFEAYLSRLSKLGFAAVEISDGTINLSKNERTYCIKRAVNLGLTVFSEVGKKDPARNPSPDQLIQKCQEDLEAGAWKVIMEARESGKNIGIYNQDGEVIDEKLDELADKLRPVLEQIIWEAPLKNQQTELILRFGPEVNLGNVPPAELLPLEALRTGLRNDTLKIITPELLSEKITSS